MDDKNIHIKEYLDYYCNKGKSTPFAVLLKGKWGCGKTYFIKKYIGSNKDFLHISLYGLSSNVDIDEKIFEALHPVLSNPRVKLAAKIGVRYIKSSFLRYRRIFYS